MLDKKCSEYLIQARKNEELVFLIKNSFSKNKTFENIINWAFTILFYSAFHYFCAFLSNRGNKIPNYHTSKNNVDQGMNELATSIFGTQKNEIIHFVGDDYNRLFQWSYEARYIPSRANLLSIEELKKAEILLKSIKLVTFNEIGYFPKINTKTKKIIIKEVKKEYLDSLNYEIKLFNT